MQTTNAVTLPSDPHSQAPAPAQRTERRRGIAAGILILAIGLSVRFPITSVSPLLTEIGAHYGLSASGLATLSSLPVLMFGIASPCAPLIVRRFGLSRALTILLALLALSVLVRPASTPLLFIGVVIGGGAIALLGILAPQLIRQALAARAGFWTGVYTTSFGVSAAAGAAFSVPLLHLLGNHVAGALASWGIPLLIALGLALGLAPTLSDARAQTAPNTPAPSPATTTTTTTATATTTTTTTTTASISVFRAPGVWAVTGYFGSQALIYFALAAWLPTIAIDRGMTPSAAGLLLAWLSVAGLPASLVAPTLASRASLRTPLIVGAALLAALALLALAFGPISVAPVAVALLGIAQSAAFGLAIALIVFTAPSAALTASFSAVSQGVGYAFAASGPLALGMLSQGGLAWSTILLVLVAVALLELAFGIAGSRASQRSGSDRGGDA